MLQSRLKRVYHFNSHMADSPMSVSWSPRSRRPSHVGHNSRCSRPRRSGAACLGGAIFPLPSSSLAGKPPVRMPILNWLTSNSDIGAAKRVPHRRPRRSAGAFGGRPKYRQHFHPRRQSGSTEGVAAVLCPPSEVDLYRPARQHGTPSSITTTISNTRKWLVMMWPRSNCCVIIYRRTARSGC